METMLSLSNDLAGAVERTAPALVTVHARRRLPSTGIHWRPGVIVTADHTVRTGEDITVTTPDGRALSAVLAGRDCIGVMPTGAGKSLTFQVPAKLLGGTVLVVSPPGARTSFTSRGVGISPLFATWAPTSPACAAPPVTLAERVRFQRRAFESWRKSRAASRQSISSAGTHADETPGGSAREKYRSTTSPPEAPLGLISTSCDAPTACAHQAAMLSLVTSHECGSGSASRSH